LKISDEDAFIPDVIYLEGIAAFEEATKTVLQLAKRWAFTRNNPKPVAD
jgi:hypothetical protein